MAADLGLLFLMVMKLNSYTGKKRLVLNSDLSSTLVHWRHPVYVTMVAPGGIGLGRIALLQPNSWEWPLSLTRHAVLMTNTRRATVTCVSHPSE